MALAYPFIVHFSVVHEQPIIGLLCVLILASAHLDTSGGRPRIALAAVVLLIALLSLFQGGLFALYLPPILISSALLWVFARSLLPGRVPLITRIAAAMGDDTPDVVAYTRSVTRVWTVFFSAMLIETIALPLVAPLEIWSLFTNVLNYVFILLLFAGELIVRSLRLPKRRSARQFLFALTKIDARSVLQ